MGTLQDKVTVITGAGSGMGKASAKVFQREGAKVVASDMSGAEKDVAAEIGGDVTPFHCDVTKEADVEALMDFAVEKFGRIDVLLNVAGIGMGGPIHTFPMENYDRVMDVDLRGIFHGLKHALRHMVEQKSGSIVNWSSLGGIQGSPGTSAYVAAKHGVVGLTKVAAAEYGRHGIRVNCLCPGFIHTEIMGAMGFKSNPGLVDKAVLGRGGQPSEVAEAAAFLASDKASFITGVILPVDGGWAVNT